MTQDSAAPPRPQGTTDPPGSRRARREADRFPEDPHLPGRSLNSVFLTSVAAILALLAVAGLFPAPLSSAAGAAMRWITATSGWSLLVIPLGLLGLLLVLALTRVGEIRLGPDGSRPEYSTLAWIAMLLGAVMGIGMITYGVAEPVSHLVDPPHGLAAPGSQEAVVDALRFTFLDWGLHAWAVFATFGLAIGYSTHRLGNKGLVSPILRPLIGRHADGALGKAIDVLVILSTLFGTTTSLGLGAAQISQGLSLLTGRELSTTGVQILVIALVTVLFTASAMSGIGRGIRTLSQTTMVIAAALLLFVLVTGPTSWLISLFLRSLGGYVGDFVEISLLLPAGGEELAWMQGWTYFMMAWWISWGAFVGIFLARISRGRTVRQFVLVVLGVPSLIFSAWFTVFGGAAMWMDLERDAGIGAAAAENVNTAFFGLLDQLPLTGVTSVVAIALVVLYFITGADSNTYVLSVISSDGRMDPARSVMCMWGLLTGATAAVLLYAGGLEALQAAVMLTAAPFILVILALAVSLVMLLRRDALLRRRPRS
ncbi:glycine/betaine ABC transporter permease [Brachybacterium vulturis]|uniref:Glycine/betaine ABC transporter permease n=1 Tax=Brachybacterium vulturis TaxID=2017484 RepID=A0A291GK95_9MICO|nr:BCCT family transporter [Brachybacterium vulturis]ATG50641.1 glycine/betaine ABC transporter permease [Brachybacterium vulturis]